MRFAIINAWGVRCLPTCNDNKVNNFEVYAPDAVSAAVRAAGRPCTVEKYGGTSGSDQVLVATTADCVGDGDEEESEQFLVVILAYDAS